MEDLSCRSASPNEQVYFFQRKLCLVVRLNNTCPLDANPIDHISCLNTQRCKIWKLIIQSEKELFGKYYMDLPYLY